MEAVAHPLADIRILAGFSGIDGPVLAF